MKINIRAIKLKICRLIEWIRFGKITPVVVDRIDYTVCEIKYIGRNNKCVGYWAYGYFDPSMPYQGGCQ